PTILPTVFVCCRQRKRVAWRAADLLQLVPGLMINNSTAIRHPFYSRAEADAFRIRARPARPSSPAPSDIKAVGSGAGFTPGTLTPVVPKEKVALVTLVSAVMPATSTVKFALRMNGLFVALPAIEALALL